MVVEEHDKQPEPEEVHHTVYSVANLITILRLLLVPFFFAVLVSSQGERGRLTAFLIYAVAASTDWIDGQIARRTHTVTQFGKIVDPLVDRLLLASGVVGLYLIDVLPPWVPLVLIARDVYLLQGAYRLEHYHVILPVTRAGKLTTTVLLAGFSSLIAGWPELPGLGVLESSWLPGWGSQPAALGIWLAYAGIVLSVTAAAQYTVIARKARARAIAAREGDAA